MTTNSLAKKTETFLQTLCQITPNRTVGSEGNRAATTLFAETMAAFGWEIDSEQFDCYGLDL